MRSKQADKAFGGLEDVITELEGIVDDCEAEIVILKERVESLEMEVEQLKSEQVA